MTAVVLLQFALVGECRSITEPRSGSDRVSSGAKHPIKPGLVRLSAIATTRSLPLLGSVTELQRLLTVKPRQYRDCGGNLI